MDEETKAAEEEAERIAAEPSLGASDLIAAAPGLARIAAGAAWRTTAWSAAMYVRTGRSILRAATSGESAAELLQRAEAELAGYLRGLGEMLETEIDAGRANGRRPNGRHPADEAPDPAERLREMGADLLRQSAEVEGDDEYHPAYARILEALAPDEARILRLMAIEGAQPSVDVRSGLPIAIGSELIAPGLTMIGAEAGCRHADRDPALPQQPQSPRPHLVLPRAGLRPAALPGARGPARRHRGALQGRPLRPHGAPQHPADAVRSRLLPDLPAPRHRRVRRARPRGGREGQGEGAVQRAPRRGRATGHREHPAGSEPRAD